MKYGESAFDIFYMLNRNNEFDCSKAERELGFRCRPFSESIRDTVIWLRKEGFVDAVKKEQGMINMTERFNV